jgi:hypothetical protein
VELRVRAGRAVLAGVPADASGDRIEVDPGNLPLGADLADALQEWAEVVVVVERALVAGSAGTATALVSRRGRQLAKRLAEVMGTPVSYADPLTGEVDVIGVPERTAPPRAARHARRAPVAEPTPWGTGLTLSAFAAVIAVFATLTLSLGLGRSNPWLALGANVMVAGGLAPSLWLARNVLVWRWVAYGVVAGILLAWVGLLFSLL